MATNQLIPLLVFLLIAAAAITAAVKAPRVNKPIRIVAALVFCPVALFSIYGFMASMEPGESNIPWRVLYPIVFLATASAIGRLVFPKSARGKEDLEKS